MEPEEPKKKKKKKKKRKKKRKKKKKLKKKNSIRFFVPNSAQMTDEELLDSLRERYQMECDVYVKEGAQYIKKLALVEKITSAKQRSLLAAKNRLKEALSNHFLVVGTQRNNIDVTRNAIKAVKVRIRGLEVERDDFVSFHNSEVGRLERIRDSEKRMVDALVREQKSQKREIRRYVLRVLNCRRCMKIKRENDVKKRQLKAKMDEQLKQKLVAAEIEFRRKMAQTIGERVKMKLASGEGARAVRILDTVQWNYELENEVRERRKEKMRNVGSLGKVRDEREKCLERINALGAKIRIMEKQFVLLKESIANFADLSQEAKCVDEVKRKIISRRTQNVSAVRRIEEQVREIRMLESKMKGLESEKLALVAEAEVVVKNPFLDRLIKVAKEVKRKLRLMGFGGGVGGSCSGVCGAGGDGKGRECGMLAEVSDPYQKESLLKYFYYQLTRTESR